MYVCVCARARARVCVGLSVWMRTCMGHTDTRVYYTSAYLILGRELLNQRLGVGNFSSLGFE